MLLNSILELWEVVNNLTRLQPSRRERYRVTIFGSSGHAPGTFAYEETKRAAALARMGCDIITGGGPGLMQAANEGAASADQSWRESIGIRVDLPFEQDVNAFRQRRIRASYVFHATAPVRARRRTRSLSPRWNRNRARNADDLAIASSASSP